MPLHKGGGFVSACPSNLDNAFSHKGLSLNVVEK